MMAALLVKVFLCFELEQRKRLRAAGKNQSLGRWTVFGLFSRFFLYIFRFFPRNVPSGLYAGPISERCEWSRRTGPPLSKGLHVPKILKLCEY